MFFLCLFAEKKVAWILFFVKFSTFLRDGCVFFFVFRVYGRMVSVELGAQDEGMKTARFAHSKYKDRSLCSLKAKT